MHYSATEVGAISSIGKERHVLSGSCHCGQLSIRYFSPLVPGKVPVRVCQCTFCRRHGGRYTSHPESRLVITASNAKSLNRYQFGTATADFLMCTRCGVVVAAVCEIGGCLRAVVNASVFDNFESIASNVSEHDFDKETLEQRLARRKRNWIPDVTLNVG